MYRPPHKDIIDFCADIDTILDKSTPEFHRHIFIGDTNCRNSEFWENDCSTTEGRVMKAWMDSSGFEQLIQEPTCIVIDTRSCIDHIFMNDDCLISEFGTRPKIRHKTDTDFNNRGH